MPDQFWWFVARSSGIVTLVLSGGAVMWGLLLSTRIIRNRSAPKWLLDLHRFLGALTVAFLVLHVVALVADSFVHFTVVDVLVPGHSAWKTAAVAWGVVAAYMYAAVQFTSVVRTHMPRKWWKRTHYLSFPAFGISFIHAATAGTDTSNRAYLVTALVLGALVVFLGSVRMIQARESRRRRAARPPAHPAGAGS